MQHFDLFRQRQETMPDAPNKEDPPGINQQIHLRPSYRQAIPSVNDIPQPVGSFRGQPFPTLWLITASRCHLTVSTNMWP